MPNPHMHQSQQETAPEWAQIEATRALAFEQARTADALEAANLIAYNALLGTAEPGEYPTTELQAFLNANRRDIETRLGLA